MTGQPTLRGQWGTARPIAPGQLPPPLVALWRLTPRGGNAESLLQVEVRPLPGYYAFKIVRSLVREFDIQWALIQRITAGPRWSDREAAADVGRHLARNVVIGNLPVPPASNEHRRVWAAAVEMSIALVERYGPAIDLEDER